MKIVKSIVLIWVLCLISPLQAQIAADAKKSDYNRNKPEREAWFRDAGLGMMLHYSMDSQLGMVISHSIVGASEDYQKRYYEELPKTFNPTHFDAEEIARVAKMAGMKYVVFTTKHHSGFCMWDTKTTDFNIMNTPYGKDLLKEYVDAVRAQGLGVGFYYSPEDWLFVRNQGALIKRVDREKIAAPFRKAYDDFIKAQCTELMSNYGKIDVIFLDGGYWPPAKEVCWDLQPDIVITRGAMESPEQTVSDVIMDHPWEAAITVNNQWAYKPSDKKIKDGKRLIEILIETRAKGGNLALNLGPKPNGSFDIDEEENLRELAAWMFVNQEAVYDVRPWIVSNEGRYWFTKAKDRNDLYIHITKNEAWERGDRKEFVLKSLKLTQNSKISVLGHNGKVVEYQPDKDPLSYVKQTQEGVSFSVIRAQRIHNNNMWDNAVVVKVTDVLPAYTPPIFNTEQAKVLKEEVNLSGKVSNDQGLALDYRFEYRLYPGFHESIYYDSWETTPWQPVKNAKVNALIKIPEGEEYQFRLVVRSPYGELQGNIKKVVR